MIEPIKAQANAPGPPVAMPSAITQRLVAAIAPTPPPADPLSMVIPSLLVSTYFAFLHSSSRPLEHALLMDIPVAVISNPMPKYVPCFKRFEAFATSLIVSAYPAITPECK
ncbi:hypothetical protein D3C79_969330 [compost metagenome]